MHAELHGASSTVIKNHDPVHPIPPLTINQAGLFTVCSCNWLNIKLLVSRCCLSNLCDPLHYETLRLLINARASDISGVQESSLG